MKMNKTETHYSTMFLLNGYHEDLGIIQESDKRGGIKISLSQDRWRTPENTVKLLEGIINVINSDFIKK